MLGAMARKHGRFIGYPTDRMLAAFRDPTQAAAAAAELTAAGIEARHLSILRGEEGARQLDGTGAAHGVTARLRRLTSFAFMDQLPDMAWYEGAVRDAIVEYASASYLDTLGLRPSLGRWFSESEERPGAPLVAVLGHQAWTRRFRADPSIVGRIIRIEGAPVTIVGIGPATYRGTLDIGLVTDFWLPIPALQTLGTAPQFNTAVQGQTGAQPEGAFFNFINWIGNVVAPVGAGGAVFGAIVGFMSGRHVGRWLMAAAALLAVSGLTRLLEFWVLQGTGGVS